MHNSFDYPFVTVMRARIKDILCNIIYNYSRNVHIQDGTGQHTGSKAKRRTIGGVVLQQAGQKQTTESVLQVCCKKYTYCKNEGVRATPFWGVKEFCELDTFL